MIKLSEQEVFDNAVIGMLTQMQVSKSPLLGCTYRGPNGLKCAIGFSIPDELYSEEFDEENFNAASVFDNLKANGKISYSGRLEFLNQLQDIHDNSEPKEWHTGLVALGFDYGLNLHAFTEVVDSEFTTQFRAAIGDNPNWRSLAVALGAGVPTVKNWADGTSFPYRKLRRAVFRALERYSAESI